MPNNEVLAGDWDIDPAHTRIGFSARHAMVTKVRGAFNDVSGHVFVNPEDPADARVEVRVQLASTNKITLEFELSLVKREQHA